MSNVAQSVRIYMSGTNKIKRANYVDKNDIAVEIVFKFIYIPLFWLRNGCFFVYLSPIGRIN